jgi:hypothetical protein
LGAGESAPIHPGVQVFTAGAQCTSNIGKELAYMRANSGFGAMQLVHSTEPFKPNLVEAILGA